MSAAVHCDRADCRAWSPAAGASDNGFLRVTWHGSGYDLCSADCLLLFFATIPPMEEVPNG